MANILIVDDEIKICEFIEAYLKREGYSTVITTSSAEAINIIDNNEIDLVILDRMIPEINGDDICKYIRDKSNIPIIIITAKAEDEDKIDGFYLGCDDYICKPFNPREMVMRVNALLRRYGIFKDASLNFENGLEINKSTRVVKMNGEEIKLTKTEYEILILLAFNSDKVFTRDQILQNVIDESYEKLDRAIDSHIKNIRKKIEPNVKEPQIIKTIYGVGYKFES